MGNRVGHPKGRTNAGERSGHCPLGIAVAAGFAAATVGCLLAALVFPPHEPDFRLVTLAVIITGSAATLQNLTGAVLTAGIAWSMYLGFLVGQAGELRWHGGVDLVRLITLVGATLLGSTRWLITDLRQAG